VRGRTRHLREERLFDCYVAARAGDSLDPPSAEHLADCVECRARYASLAHFLDGLRADADAETDAVFPAERLRLQQAQIADRLEHVGHAARVISFPGHGAGTPLGGKPRMAPRWIAAAAAAGLFIGIYVGTFFDTGSREARSAPAQAGNGVAALPVVARPVAIDSAPDPLADVADSSNDEFLSELEFALERPRTHELIALDELTPHVREVSASLGVRLR
jgi:hypothetical protein